MAVTFHILSASGILTGALRARLEAVLSESASLCAEKLALGDVDVVVMNAPKNVIPRIGVNGFAHDAHHVVLSLDHGHPHLREHFGTAIGALLAHELHHSARSLARGSSHGDTYGGTLVAEGLACCFEEETGAPTPFYAVECRGAALARFAEKAKAHLDVKHGKLSGFWGDWTFGRAPDDPEFPYQCGYSTGYALVRCWLDATGKTASAAAAIAEAEVLRDWTEGRINPFR